MNHIFWLVPNLLAGRCGPDQQPWHLKRLRQAGFGAVLSVNDGDHCRPEDFAQHGLAYACIPLSSNAPPCDGDLEHCLNVLPTALSFAKVNIDHGIPVLVHCSAGKDRTGLFMAYYLMQCEGCSLQEAMERVRAARPVAFSADGWHDFAFQVLSPERRGASLKNAAH
jgi:protein-tyrosine phosphatase